MGRSIWECQMWVDTPQNTLVGWGVSVTARNEGILAGTSWWHVLVAVWTWINLDAEELTWSWGISTLALGFPSLRDTDSVGLTQIQWDQLGNMGLRGLSRI